MTNSPKSPKYFVDGIQVSQEEFSRITNKQEKKRNSMFSRSEIATLMNNNKGLLTEVEFIIRSNKMMVARIWTKCDKDDPCTEREFRELNYYRNYLKALKKEKQALISIQKKLKKPTTKFNKYAKAVISFLVFAYFVFIALFILSIIPINQ